MADLEPKSQGFSNRATESINIIGNVVEDFFNGLGGAISDIAGQHHGSHLNINGPGEPSDPQERMRRREFEFVQRTNDGVNDRINRGHFNPAPVTQGSVRIQKFIDNDDADFFI